MCLLTKKLRGGNKINLRIETYLEMACKKQSFCYRSGRWRNLLFRQRRGGGCNNNAVRVRNETFTWDRCNAL